MTTPKNDLCLKDTLSKNETVKAKATTTIEAAAAATATVATITTSLRDSDSGHGGQTESSSASNSSQDDLSRQESEDQVNIDDCFVDASEIFPSTNGDTFCQLNSLNLEPFQHHCEGNDVEKVVKEAGEFDEKELPKQEEEEEEEKELKVRLEEVTVILRMALNNEFVKALEICGRSASQELYSSLAHATLSFLRAALTMEQPVIQAALSSINQSFEVSSKLKRKSSTASIVMRFLYRPNYNHYTDDQIHAELVQAESLLLLALISFLSDQSIICLVKGAFRIRTCYQRYKECLYIMENRTNWSSEEARKHFESGVRMGHGIFNLLMSYLPRRVLRFLEYVGFSGNRSIAIDELDKSVALNDGLRSTFSTLVILTYHTYIENLFGLGNYDSNKVKQLNNNLQIHYPQSAFYFLFLGRYHQMQGELDTAIASYEKCIQAQDDWKQFHSICHWEIMWCYAVQMNWDKAAYYSDLLRKQSKWSPASYTYQYGTFLYAKLIEDERQGLCEKESIEYKSKLEEIVKIIRKVPELRIRFAGKTIPAEKFAITRSDKFCEQNNRLTLPALEFLYIWNIFVTLKNSPEQVEKLLFRIDTEIVYIINNFKAEATATTNGTETKVNESTNDTNEYANEETNDNNVVDNDQVNHWNDDLGLCWLLKGMCLKYLDRLEDAEENFMKVIEHESKFVVDTFLVPHTAMELALLKLTKGNFEESKRWIKLARNNYTGYLLETMVHFRLHAASRIIRIEEQQDSLLNQSFESQ